MRDLLNIWQVYFDNKSKRNCYLEYNHYNNEGKLTENFENSVIVDLIDKEEHLKADYFSLIYTNVDHIAGQIYGYHSHSKFLKKLDTRQLSTNQNFNLY